MPCPSEQHETDHVSTDTSPEIKYGPYDGKEQLELGFRHILEGLGLDPDDPHVKDTPKRAAEAWYDELCEGLTKDGGPDVTTFPASEKDMGMVVLQGIPVKSICSHHLLPFVGTATVGYIPGGNEILGLSKLSRITNYYARRPQVQERLTNQIADDIWERIKGSAPGLPESNPGVGVQIRASHMCMELRGVEHSGQMVTEALRGTFKRQDETRNEFLSLAREDNQ